MHLVSAVRETEPKFAARPDDVRGPVTWTTTGLSLLIYVSVRVVGIAHVFKCLWHTHSHTHTHTITLGVT